MKITFPDDLPRVAAGLSAGLLPRIGTGFDVHRVAPGRAMVLARSGLRCVSAETTSTGRPRTGPTSSTAILTASSSAGPPTLA